MVLPPQERTQQKYVSRSSGADQLFKAEPATKQRIQREWTGAG